MDDRKSQERKAFLAEVEENFQRGDFETMLSVAGLRLMRLPDDLDARMAICRVWIEQGKVREAGDLLAEMERFLTDLNKVYASLKTFRPATAPADETLPPTGEPEPPPAAEASPVLPLDLPSPAERRSSEPASEARNETAEQAEAAARDEDLPREETVPEAPADFQTVTLAELYIRQGHLQPAAEVLAKIVGREPQNERATALLREVRDRRHPEEAVRDVARRQAAVTAELSRWLDNIGRLRAHGG